MFGSNKRAVETFIVSKAAQTTMPVTGSLVNTTTGNINLADGQIGIVSAGINGTVPTWNFVDATPTITEAQAIRFVQGTPNSANLASATAKYPLWVRPYEFTEALKGHKKDITVTKQTFTLASHDVVELGTIDGFAAVSNTTYQIHIAFSGARNELFFSNENGAGLRAIYTTPDFAVAGITSGSEKNHKLAANLVTAINLNSNGLNGLGKFKGTDSVVAFGVTDVPVIGANAKDISTIAAGNVINVCMLNGVMKTITLTAEMAASLLTAYSNANGGFTHIIAVDKDSTSTFSGPVQGIWVVALDEATAYVDYIPQIKNYIKVALPEGFQPTILNTQVSWGKEGQGYSRVLDLYYKATQGQRKYFNQHNLDPIINFPSPIVDGTNYVVYNVVYSNEMQIDSANISVSPHKAVICIPAETTPAVVNPLIATLDSTLNSWLTSTGNPSILTI